jgi:hypothetical protein
MRLFRRRPAPAADRSFAVVQPGTRWLVCDTTVCGHMTVRHVPVRDGFRCLGCDQVKAGGAA